MVYIVVKKSQNIFIFLFLKCITLVFNRVSKRVFIARERFTYTVVGNLRPKPASTIILCGMTDKYNCDKYHTKFISFTLRKKKINKNHKGLLVKGKPGKICFRLEYFVQRVRAIIGLQ